LNFRRVDSSLSGFEWWYLQICTPEYSATIAIHTTELLGGVLGEPYISVTIFGPQGRITRDHIPFSMSDASWTKEGFIVIRDRMAESATGWNLTLNSACWSIRGSVARSAQVWRVDDSLLVPDGNGDGMHWAIPMPRGIWKGVISTDEEVSSALHGYAYQDHNWAERPLTEFVSGWSWRVLANNRATVIWADVESCSGQVPGLGISISSKGRMKQIKRPPRIRSGSSVVVKGKRYRRESFEASYERAAVRGRTLLVPPRGFSECVSVTGGVLSEYAVFLDGMQGVKAAGHS
jgi:hypothetical protein